MLVGDVARLEPKQVEVRCSRSKPSSVRQAILKGLIEEVKADYLNSAKCAILNYVLRHPGERTRLGLPVPPATPPDWGSCVVPREPPASW